MKFDFQNMFAKAAGSIAIMALSFPALAAPDVALPEAQSGLPQLDTSTYASQIFWLIVAFVLLYVMMSKVALPKVSEVLEIRESEINTNLNRAEKFQSEIEDVRSSYEKALEKAHADAAAVVQKIEEATTAKVNAKQGQFSDMAKDRLAKSEKNIQAAKNEVLSSLEDIAADITKDAVKKIADISIKKEAALKVVKQNMQEVA